jgi:fatty-acyl-CoA synthase
MATHDQEGFIEIVDRKKDLIISGGENVSSIEVEGMLYKHPAVLEAACIAIPDEKWGEAPAAIVVLKPETTASEEDLINFCRENMAHFKCPRSISFVDALPRTATGKSRRIYCVDAYWQGEGRGQLKAQKKSTELYSAGDARRRPTLHTSHCRGDASVALNDD